MPQGWEWLIILLIALLLFGGTKLAGLGKASGRAIREFKEETKDLKDDKKALEQPAAAGTQTVVTETTTVTPAQPVVEQPVQPVQDQVEATVYVPQEGTQPNAAGPQTPKL